jgi:hypothetical protein
MKCEVDISDYLNINSPISTKFSNFTSWGDVEQHLTPEYYTENDKYEYPILMSLHHENIFYPSRYNKDRSSKYYDDLQNIFGSSTYYLTLNFHFLSLLYLPLGKFPICQWGFKNIIVPLHQSLPVDCSRIWMDALSLSNLSFDVITKIYPKLNHKLLPLNKNHISNPDYHTFLEKLHTQFLLSKL